MERNDALLVFVNRILFVHLAVSIKVPITSCYRHVSSKGMGPCKSVLSSGAWKWKKIRLAECEIQGKKKRIHAKGEKKGVVGMKC
jgi:hypothetical protein